MTIKTIEAIAANPTIQALAVNCPWAHGARRFVLSRPHGRRIHGPELTELDVSFCPDLTDDAFTAPNWPCLTRHGVAYCRDLTHEAFTAIAMTSPAPTALNVQGRGLDAASIKAIAANCSAFTSLDASYSYEVTNECLMTIATSSTSCSSPTSLNIRGCGPIIKTVR